MVQYQTNQILLSLTVSRLINRGKATGDSSGSKHRKSKSNQPWKGSCAAVGSRGSCRSGDASTTATGSGGSRGGGRRGGGRGGRGSRGGRLGDLDVHLLATAAVSRDATDEVAVALGLDRDGVITGGKCGHGRCCIAGVVVGLAHLKHVVEAFVVLKHCQHTWTLELKLGWLTRETFLVQQSTTHPFGCMR